MDFYITLPSGPTKRFAFNTSTLSSYFFENPIKLDGEYEVALVQTVFEDCYPTFLGTIKVFHSMDANFQFSVDMYAKDGENFKTVIKNVNKKLKYGYSNLKKSKSFKELNLLISEMYADNTVPEVELTKENDFFLINPLGWEMEIINHDKYNIYYPYNKTKLGGKFYMETFRHTRKFYVTLNAIEDQIFAERKYPLLANFVLDDIKSNVICKEFQNPRYIKVKDKEIRHLEIEYSENIDAQLNLPGNITSVLHFRKINGL